MKNRTLLTLVISLFVCSLTAGAFAQTNPSVLKPEGSTLEISPGDVQSVQEEKANDQCPYKVVPGDKVYLQIKNVKLRSDNLPLYPYFYVYGENGKDRKYISGTSSQDGNQICETVQNPANFKFYIDNTYKECCLDVYSDYGDILAARGVVFKTDKLIEWAKNPQNVGKTFPTPLEISKGNTITLKYDYSSSDRYYYFEIVSYNITNTDNEYKKYIYEAYQTWLLIKQKDVVDKWLYYYKGDKVFNPSSDNALDYAEIKQSRYNNTQRELLFSCTEGNNVQFMFSFNGKDYSLDTVELTTDDVVKQLNDCMKKYPDDYTKWVVKCVSKQNSEMELIFAGFDIQTDNSDIETSDSEVGSEKSSDASSPDNAEKQEEKAEEASEESSCPYKVTNDDKVYLQISKTLLRSDNLPLKPYFYLYGINNDKETYISSTSALAGNQLNKKVAYPSYYHIVFDNSQQNYRLDVYSNLNNQIVAKGIPFNISELIKWTDHPYNRGRTFYLPISDGNVIGLKNVKINNGKYDYEIVSYTITSIDDNYKKYIYESYKSWMIIKQEGVDDKWFYYYNGDKTFFPATKNAPEYTKMVLNNHDKNKQEFLLSCTANKTISLNFTNQLGTLDTIELSTDDVVKQLNDCMKKYPNDHAKWVVKCVSKQNSEIELNFAGIRRVYRIATVTIPARHPKRQVPRYSEKGYAPWLRIYIQQDGIPCGMNSPYARPGRRAWDCDVPNDKYNRFEIREGMRARFSLQIQDADTWFYEIFHVNISGIKDLDFHKKKIYENLGFIEDEEKRAVVEIESVTE